ncbi:MAG: phospholipase D-like domain-containing protein [Bdellovibrionota bacterium]
MLSLALVVFTAQTAQADKVTYLAHDNAALADLYTKIRDADHEIDMTYFIFDFCNPMTLVLMKQLKDKIAAKKAEGKTFHARILVDGSADIRLNDDKLYDKVVDAKSVTAYYAKQGIEVRYFNQEVGYDKPLSNFRTHLKLTVVDGKKMVTGGRNIEPDYYGLSASLNWVDRDVSVEGPQSAKAAADFDDLWNSKYSYSESAPKPEVYAHNVQRCFGQWNPKEIRIDDYLKKNADAILAALPSHECSDVSYVMDKKFGFRYMTRLETQPATEALTDLLSSAKKSVSLENYDYLPSSAIKGALTKQRAQIPITTYTNNFQKTGEPVDWPTFREAKKDSTGLETVRQLSQFGSLNDRWELTPNSSTFMIHSKVYETDGENVAVSTANLDPRSYHSNLESALMVKNCAAFASQVRETTEGLKKFVDTDSYTPCLGELDHRPGAIEKIYYKLIEQLL